MYFEKDLSLSVIAYYIYDGIFWEYASFGKYLSFLSCIYLFIWLSFCCCNFTFSIDPILVFEPKHVHMYRILHELSLLELDFI